MDGRLRKIKLTPARRRQGSLIAAAGASAAVNRHCLNGAQLSLRYIERCITRDARIPLSDDDREMDNGWRCIPIPPTDKEGWFILDSSRDYKTEWGCWRDLLDEAAA